MLKHTCLLFVSLILLSTCQTGKLDNLTDLPNDLKEVSALEYTPADRLLWIIEDSGNANNLYALDAKAQLTKTIKITNAKNEDWEDLTSDKQGNIYIGDFGNNNKKRDVYTIYKINTPAKVTDTASAEIINFKLPKDLKPLDFESFFLFKNRFYIFSKDDKKGIMISVENKKGDQKAKLLREFNLNGKDNKITSAAISTDGKTVLLLNHDKVWKLTNFKSNDFFAGNIEAIDFSHKSQKEGIIFITETEVFITDEYSNGEGANLYRFEL